MQKGKFYLKTLVALGVLAGLSVTTLFATGNEHLIRAFQLTYLKGHSTANINDHRDFDTRLIGAGENQPWAEHAAYNQQPLPAKLQQLLTESNSAAFLVIKDGQILAEHYFAPYSVMSKTNSFSMAKTMNTLLVASAIEDGLIESFDTPVEQLIPELKGRADGVTLAHLSAMTSGLEWTENYYSPLSPVAKLVYGYDVESYVLQHDYSGKPGENYYYSSASTQVLGVALQRALGGKGVSEYLAEKYWQPLGMNDDALWHTDSKGTELVYCCVSTNARNFAKFGQLLLQGGQWQGEQLVAADFVERMLAADREAYYGHSVWIDDRPQANFKAMIGHLGQYVAMVPEHNMVVVRLGEFRHPDYKKTTGSPIPDELGIYVDETIKWVDGFALQQAGL
jgi:CubicO group peptidase (beta-lactamase class C family)